MVCRLVCVRFSPLSLPSAPPCLRCGPPLLLVSYYKHDFCISHFFWGGLSSSPSFIRFFPPSFPPFLSFLPRACCCCCWHVSCVRVCVCVCLVVVWRVVGKGYACVGVDDDVHHQHLASTSPSVRPRRDKRISNFLPRSWFEPCSGWPVLVLKGFVPEF